MEPNNNTLPAPTVHHHSPRVSLFWPIILIGLGVVLLLSNMHYLPGNVWEWIWRLWPAILIAWGLDALIRAEFAGATVLIGLGGLFLAATFGYFSLNPLEILFRLWPVFLVSAGVGIVFNRRYLGIWGALAGAVIMVVVLALAIWQLNGQLLSAAAAPGTRVTQRLENASKANVSITRADGSLYVKALSEPSALVDGVVRLPESEKLNTSYTVQDGVANFTVRSDGAFVGLGPVNSDWYRWDLGLSPNVPTSLRVDQGAGNTVMDLSEMQVNTLTENQAVGSTTITLPQTGDVQVRLNAAIGAATVIVPQGAGIQLHVSGVLVGADVPPEYEHQGVLYTSPNYESSAHHMDIYISTAIGSLTVRSLPQTGR
jgi:hypothetical protein